MRDVRDGVKSMIPTTEVVPLDVIYLIAGDRIPADLHVIESANLARSLSL